MTGNKAIVGGQRVAAEREVRQLLASFGWTAPESCDRFVEEVLATAVMAVEQGAAEPLASIARDDAEAALGRWLADLLGLGEPREALLVGRAACLVSRAPARWPQVEIGGAAPQVFVEALRQAAPPAVPEAAPSAMVAQPYLAWSLVDVVQALPFEVGALRDLLVRGLVLRH